MERVPRISPTNSLSVDPAIEAAMESLGATLHARDHRTYAHSARLVRYARRLGKVLGLSAERLLILERGAFLHDIGKLLVHEHILSKPGPLSDSEWRTMRRHPASGYRLVIATPVPEPVADIVLTHHEWYDGTGYPLGLKRTAISLEARICALVDMADALTSARPYRNRIGFEAATAEIAAESGSHFDPLVVEAWRTVPASEWAELSRLDLFDGLGPPLEPTVPSAPHSCRRLF